jgi:hypothetical protein
MFVPGGLSTIRLEMINSTADAIVWVLGPSSVSASEGMWTTIGALDSTLAQAGLRVVAPTAGKLKAGLCAPAL